jgi:hypothetical protein
VVAVAVVLIQTLVELQAMAVEQVVAILPQLMVLLIKAVAVVVLLEIRRNRAVTAVQELLF